MIRGSVVTHVIAAVVVGLTVLEVGLYGAGEDGLRVVVRSTARSSLLLFALAFGASGLRRIWRVPATAWLLANRRYVGVGFAVSLWIHAAALWALGQVSPAFRADVDPVTLVGGGAAYAFATAMALSSSDRAVAALGRRRWKLLHTVGGWYVWLIFAQSYLPRAIETPTYWIAGAVVLAIPALRLAARRPVRRLA